MLLEAGGPLSQLRCASTSGCKGIEFSSGHCEVWTREAGIQATVPRLTKASEGPRPKAQGPCKSGLTAVFLSEAPALGSSCLRTSAHARRT